MRTLDQTVTRYVRNCARTYLEGGQSLRWVIACITRSGLPLDRATAVLNELRAYGNPQAWRAFNEALASAQR